MLLSELIQSPELISEFSCFFKIHCLRCCSHIELDFLRQIVRLAGQQSKDSLNEILVLLFLNSNFARSQTSSDAVVIARPADGTEDVRSAFDQRKKPLNHTLCCLKLGSIGIGTKIGTAVVLALACLKHSGPLFFERNLEVGVGLIVPQQNVVGRPVVLNQVVFEQKGFVLVVDNHDLKIGDTGNQSPCFRGMSV